MDAFGAIADPTRREILELLAKGPHSSGEIAGKFAMSAAAISQHLKTLRDTRLVEVRVDTQKRIYSLDRRGFKEVERWLMRYQFFWSAKLDALEDALKADKEVRRAAKPVMAKSARSMRKHQ